MEACCGVQMSLENASGKNTVLFSKYNKNIVDGWDEYQNTHSLWSDFLNKWVGCHLNHHDTWLQGLPLQLYPIWLMPHLLELCTPVWPSMVALDVAVLSQQHPQGWARLGKHLVEKSFRKYPSIHCSVNEWVPFFLCHNLFRLKHLIIIESTACKYDVRVLILPF